MLTELEVSKIESNLLDIRSVGEDAVAPFFAVHVPNASVSWVNETWFLERGLDVTNEAVRRRLDQWLIAEFAFVVPEQAISTVAAGKTFFADLYGSSGMATHGGSGRVGISGRFQVKGIGRTPLVGVAHDWLHSHGCLWLEEALREAVYSEVVRKEFPHGAVPVLAVIDTGLRHTDENGQPGQYRALTVRPVVFRPAYFERAILFQPPGEEKTGRERDARRVRQVVKHIEAQMGHLGASNFSEMLERTFTRISQQIAFARAHRLFPGNYASSNLTIDGELLDFGPFRALPNWCRSISMNDVEGFGNEVVEINEAVRSITFYINKYKESGSAEVDALAVLNKFSEELEQAFERELLFLFNLDDAPDDIRIPVLSAILGYYATQQRVEVRFQNGCLRKLGWLDGAFLDDQNRTSDYWEDLVITRLNSAIKESALGPDEKKLLCSRMRATGARLLPPRCELYRESLMDSLNRALHDRDRQAGSDTSGSADLVCGRSPDDFASHCFASNLEKFVNAIVSRNRRHWPSLPRGLVVRAQYASPRWSALYCAELAGDKHFLWVEAICLERRVWIDGHWRELVELESYTEKIDKGWWFGLLPAEPSSARTTAGLELSLPDDAVWF